MVGQDCVYGVTIGFCSHGHKRSCCSGDAIFVLSIVGSSTPFLQAKTQETPPHNAQAAKLFHSLDRTSCHEYVLPLASQDKRSVHS